MQGASGVMNQSYAARSAQAYENANKSNPYPSQQTQYHHYPPMSPPAQNAPPSQYHHGGNVGNGLPSYANNAMYPNPYIVPQNFSPSTTTMTHSPQPAMMVMNMPQGPAVHVTNTPQFSQSIHPSQGYPPPSPQPILPPSSHVIARGGPLPIPPSSNSLMNSNVQQANQEQHFLNESIRRMQESIYIMRGAMEANDLATTLERASAMLGELGDPSHHASHHSPSISAHHPTMKEPQGVSSPKQYYELHMLALEELPNLEEYLLQLSQGGMAGAGFALKSSFTMKELYDIVQYCPRAVPRLYLQICAGSALIRSIMMKEGGGESNCLSSVQDVLKDLQDSVKCVQCPIRGLFLRHYMLQAVKDKLPDEERRINVSQPLVDKEETITTSSDKGNELKSTKENHYVDPNLAVSTINVKQNEEMEELMEGLDISPKNDHLEAEKLWNHSEKMNELMEDLGVEKIESNALFDDVVIDDMPPLPSSPPPPVPSTSSEIHSGTETTLDLRLGTVKDSYEFVLSNFIEMNKLWVRIQHLPGDSKSKDIKMRRERERNELRMMVGTNLVRLSELEGVTSAIYGTIILPKVLDQIVACQDPLAQAYLMDCIIQVFPDEFHIQTLEVILSVCPKLRDKVNVRTILQSIMDRLAKYHADELLLNDEEDTEGVKMSVMLDSFHIFDECIRSVFKSRGTKLTAREAIRLEYALLNFCLRCYPRRTDYINTCLGVCASALRGEFSVGATGTGNGNILLSAVPLPLDDSAVSELEHLLSLPLDALSLRVFELEYYSSLLSLLPLDSSKQVALRLLTALDSSMEHLSNKDIIDQLFAIIDPILKRGAKTSEYELVAKAIFLVFNENPDIHFDLLIHVKHIIQVAAGKPLYLVPLFYTSLKFLNTLKVLEFTKAQSSENNDKEKNEYLEDVSKDSSIGVIEDAQSNEYFSSEEDNFAEVGEETERTDNIPEPEQSLRNPSTVHGIDQVSLKVTCRKVFIFLQNIILSLKSNTPDQAVKLSLHAATAADALSVFVVERGGNLSEYSPITYEFMTEALSCYEATIHTEYNFPENELISIVGTFCLISTLENRDFESLITKVTQCAARLPKKNDQCRLVMLCSHLFFSSKETGYRNPQRVLECLQRALKVADICVNSNPADLHLFVDILDCYLHHFDNINPVITDRYISGLVSLIYEHISKIGMNPIISDVKDEFKRTIRYIEDKKNDPQSCNRYEKIVCKIVE